MYYNIFHFKANIHNFLKSHAEQPSFGFHGTLGTIRTIYFNVAKKIGNFCTAALHAF